MVFIIALNITSCSVNNNNNNNNVSELKDSNTSQYIIEQKNTEVPNTEEIINTLCSDDFGGRYVGSEGNLKAQEYIVGILKKIEIEPLYGETYYESYTQEVFKTYGFSDDPTDNGEEKEINNILGVIRGSDSTKAVVISAHLDHVGYQDGKIIRGALDNASGVATLMRIANTLKNESKNKVFGMDIIIASFNGEETGQVGSMAFVKEIKNKYSNLYNINIDCVGGKKAGKISLNNKSKISDKLTEAMKETFKSNNMDFSDVELKGATSDHSSFEEKSIPNIFIGQDNLKLYVHNETDNPDTLDDDEIDKMADVVSNFIVTNDGKTFEK